MTTDKEYFNPEDYDNKDNPVNITVEDYNPEAITNITFCNLLKDEHASMLDRLASFLNKHIPGYDAIEYSFIAEDGGWKCTRTVNKLWEIETEVYTHKWMAALECANIEYQSKVKIDSERQLVKIMDFTQFIGDKFQVNGIKGAVDYRRRDEIIKDLCRQLCITKSMFAKCLDYQIVGYRLTNAKLFDTSNVTVEIVGLK